MKLWSPTLLMLTKLLCAPSAGLRLLPRIGSSLPACRSLQSSARLRAIGRSPLAIRLLATTSTESRLEQLLETSHSCDAGQAAIAGRRDPTPRVKIPNVKARQHVNPLARIHQQPLELPENWLASSFRAPSQPLILDIGCARGNWAIAMAKANADVNLLGLEIRPTVVEMCIARKAYWNLTNAHFFESNANVDMTNLLRSLRDGRVPISVVTIQFPDPHFKKRHKKRRLVNEEFVRILAEGLPAECQVYLQTDIQELAEDMVMHFLAEKELFLPANDYDPSQLEANPARFSIQTEREIATASKGLPVYRMMFIRSAQPYPAA